MKIIGFITLIVIGLCLLELENQIRDLSKQLKELRHDLIFSACKNE